MKKKYKTYIKACESQIGRYAEQYNNKETLTKNTKHAIIIIKDDVEKHYPKDRSDDKKVYKNRINKNAKDGKKI